jgi:hypothetical protein
MKEHFTNIKTVLGILLLLVFHVLTFNLNLECRLLIVKIDKGFCSYILISLLFLLKLSTLYALQRKVIGLEHSIHSGGAGLNQG